MLQGAENVVVGRLLVEREHEHSLEAHVQVLWDHAEELPRVRLLQPLLQVVLEVQILVLEHLVEVGPGQLLVVEEVNQNVKGSFYIISTRLGISTARIERREKEVAAELVQLLLLNVLAVSCRKVGRGQSKIDEIDNIRVLVSDKNILQLYVIVDEVKFMK